MKSPILASSTLAMAAAVALGLTAGVALAQEAGFGGQGNVSKNQVPGSRRGQSVRPGGGKSGLARADPDRAAEAGRPLRQRLERHEHGRSRQRGDAEAEQLRSVALALTRNTKTPAG